MFFGRCPRIKGTEVPAFAGFWILFPGVEPVFPRFKFSNHIRRLFLFGEVATVRARAIHVQVLLN